MPELQLLPLPEKPIGTLPQGKELMRRPRVRGEVEMMGETGMRDGGMARAACLSRTLWHFFSILVLLLTQTRLPDIHIYKL